MDLFADIQASALVSTVVYCGFGLILYLVAYFLIEKLTPFSVRKEIEDDQNVALGIIIGAMMLGLAIIIGSVILSPSDSRKAASAAKTEAPAADATK